MTVKIEIYYHNKYDILKKLTDELKTKNTTILEEKTFWIDLELNVNSFDEIICLLEKYSNEIEIELSIYSINKVRMFISKRETSCSLGNQVE